MKKILLLIISLSFCYCSEEHATSFIQNSSSRIKSMKLYSSLQSSEILAVDDYEYNDLGQLNKVNHYGGDREVINNYELYIYDLNYRLKIELDYHSNINSPTGFLLLDSTEYVYSGVLLICKKSVHPIANYTDSSIYDYRGDSLWRISKYHSGILDSWTIYHYKQGQIDTEYTYASNNTIFQTIVFSYYGSLLAQSRYYTSQGNLLRTIDYLYDDRQRLIIEAVDENAPYSSALSHVHKYEY